MDAPFPVQINESMNKDLDIIIESNSKKKYYIEITNNSKSYLYINIHSINQIPNLRYEEKFTLEQIKKISQYFTICKSISDIVSSIKTNINKSDLIEENKKIKLIIKINHPIYKEAIIQIPEKQTKLYDQNELFYLIIDFKKTFQNQQNIIQNQQKDINELKEKVKILENEIKNIKIEKEKKEEKNEIKEEIKEEKEEICYFESKKDFEKSIILLYPKDSFFQKQ